MTLSTTEWEAGHVPGDGHCLFSSIGVCLGRGGASEVVYEMRVQCAQYIMANLLDIHNGWSLVVHTHNQTPHTYNKHIRHMGLRPQWGTALEIAILARVCRVPIEAYQGHRGYDLHLVWEARALGTWSADHYNVEPIRILYENGCHYSPILRRQRQEPERET